MISKLLHSNWFVISCLILLWGFRASGQNAPYPRLESLILDAHCLQGPGDKELLLQPLFHVREDEVFRRYGVFCRWETMMQRKQRIPLYFKIGDKAYVDYLDGHNKSYLLKGR